MEKKNGWRQIHLIYGNACDKCWNVMIVIGLKNFLQHHLIDILRWFKANLLITVAKYRFFMLKHFIYFTCVIFGIPWMIAYGIADQKCWIEYIIAFNFVFISYKCIHVSFQTCDYWILIYLSIFLYFFPIKITYHQNLS